MSTLLLLATLLPVPVAMMVVSRGRIGASSRWLARWIGLPPLLIVLAPGSFEPIGIEWLLLGSRFSLDPVGRVFLVGAAAVWAMSAIFAGSAMRGEASDRFWCFFLLAMSGNLVLPLAADAVTFYAFFSLMTFAGYGIIAHDRTRGAMRAGSVYISMAVASEVLTLVGMLFAVAIAGSTDLAAIRGAIVGSPGLGMVMVSIGVGFAIKVGSVPLHFWLPLAHPVAPTPASAALSGAMIHAGLLGWIRFLPIGTVSMPRAGFVVASLGLFAAIYAVLVGLVQSDSKTILAYSSISQMGMVGIAFGMGLVDAGAGLVAVPPLAIYAAHHGLAKAGLFLATVVAHRGGTGARNLILLGGIGILALALAGMPFTTGAIAKHGLKAAITSAPDPWGHWFGLALSAAAGATMLLMLHFVSRLRSEEGLRAGGMAPGGMIGPLAVLAAAVAVLPTVIRQVDLGEFGIAAEPVLLVGMVEELLPIAAAIAIAAVTVQWRRRRGEPPLPTIAPGDILVVLERALEELRRRRPHLRELPVAGPPAIAAEAWFRLYSEPEGGNRLIRTELAISRWRVGAAFMLLVSALVFVLLHLS